MLIILCAVNSVPLVSVCSSFQISRMAKGHNITQCCMGCLLVWFFFAHFQFSTESSCILETMFWDVQDSLGHIAQITQQLFKGIPSQCISMATAGLLFVYLKMLTLIAAILSTAWGTKPLNYLLNSWKRYISYNQFSGHEQRLICRS